MDHVSSQHTNYKSLLGFDLIVQRRKMEKEIRFNSTPRKLWLWQTGGTGESVR
jgi:hypothetical protein